MNKNIFGSSNKGPVVDTVNQAGGIAYKMSDKEALAQLATTGCFNNTYYSTAEDQTKTLIDLLGKVDQKFAAQVAIYSRQKGNMKDMPSVICAYLFAQRSPYFATVFNQVIDNGKMIRNFCKVVRSGIFGRKSFGTVGKRVIQNWLTSRKNLFGYIVGNDPSLKDIVNMVHPKPLNSAQEALFGYILGKEVNQELLPVEIQEYENFRKGFSTKVPNVPFEMLTNLNLPEAEWKTIAMTAGWQMTRMNLNTFLRHGVFKDLGMVKMITDRLINKQLILKSRCFPYQLMMAYLMVKDNFEMPNEIKNALQVALEIATENVPSYDCNVIICPDVSASMNTAVTGQREGATTKVTCTQVAALITATLARKNPQNHIFPFDTAVKNVYINPFDSIMTNAEKLRMRGGGTNCAVSLQHANQHNIKADLVVYISDNESWVNCDFSFYGHGNNKRTDTVKQWEVFKKRNPNAKLVLIDLAPNTSLQIKNTKDILNIGSWNDSIFEVINSFVNGDSQSWIKEIEKIQI